ncbi:MAG: VanZ family protein [Sediminimonas qiaohouensis]|uniref:VanZ family protein n=1 Tax=Sediminimonas qiaohouensis TaxID=552061 RepID=A0A7C9HBI3_9RHOB|nr:VanZ family protein [Sediminimonas qiaohouensis]MTJ05090.1 VanZ family protein [Sediminimonas qiaohouensis]
MPTRWRPALRAATWGLAACIAVAMLMPAQTIPQPGGSDKLHHMLAFGALSVPAAMLYPGRALGVVLCVIVFGGALELIQPLTGRFAEGADLIADGIGALAGVGIGLMLNRILAARTGP